MLPPPAAPHPEHAPGAQTLVERYLEHVRVEKRLAPRTVELYALDLQKLMQFAALAGLEPCAVENTHIRRWIVQMHAGGRSGRGIALVLSGWRGFYAWLGREALTWVLWRSESSEPLCEVEELPLSVLFTGKLLLRAAAGEVTEVAVKGVSAPYSAIVRQALEKGILVHGARLQLNHGEQTFEVTLDAEFFDFKSAKLPQLLQEEEAEQRIERLELVGRLGRLVDALISEFTAVRLSPGWKKTVVPQIRQWLDQNAA